MKVLGLFLILSVSPFVHSSEIVVNNRINILAVDGVKTKSTFFGKNKVEVEDGTHQIVVRYNHKFKNDDRLESRPYIFDIDVQGDTALSTDKHTTYAQAEENLKQGLTWYVKNQTNEYTIDNAAQLNGQGFMPYRDIEKLVSNFNQENGLSITTDNGNEGNNKNYLIEQYKAATQEQKQQFKAWFIQH